MNPLFSVIIVTCKNDITHLKDCIDSVRRTLQSFSFEIIVVDNTLENPIIDADIVIRNKENMYCLESRRLGLDCAHGDYVWFIDADDITVNILDDFIPGADLYQFNFQLLDKDGIHNRYAEFSGDILKNFFNGVWSRFFRREFIIEALKPIDRNIKLFHKEDLVIMKHVLYKKPSISFIKQTLYQYNLTSSYLKKPNKININHSEEIELLKEIFINLQGFYNYKDILL